MLTAIEPGMGTARMRSESSLKAAETCSGVYPKSEAAERGAAVEVVEAAVDPGGREQVAEADFR